MDPTTLLAQLRDVHAPDKIGAWPPALGLVILIVLACLITAAIIFFIFRWYRNNAWRRSALKEFKRINETYKITPSKAALIEISSLLKRCVASINQDSSMLALTGDDWKEVLLNTNDSLGKEEIDLLCYGHYQVDFNHLDTDALHRIQRWIKKLPSTPITKKQEFKKLTSKNTPSIETKVS